MSQTQPVQVFEASIVVPAERHEAYTLWLEERDIARTWADFDEVRQLDPKRFAFRAVRDGVEIETIAEIMLQIPGRRIAWRTIQGPESSGVVCFEAAPAPSTATPPSATPPGESTQITLKLRYTPDDGWNRKDAVERRILDALTTMRGLVEQKRSGSPE